MKKPVIQLSDAIDQILSAGLSAVENDGSFDSGHLTIIGGVRRVQFWTTTGTVYSDKEGDKPAVKGRGIKSAIHLAKYGRFNKK